MNLSISSFLFFVSIYFLTIGIQAQEKVTKESTFSDKKSSNLTIRTTVKSPSKTLVHNPNHKLNTQINQTLINDTTPSIIPVFKHYLLEINPTASLAIVELKTIEEIRKEL